MPEPAIVEPVGGMPLGNSGTAPEPTKTAEPASTDGAPVVEDYSNVDFNDLKTVPEPLQKAAKALQGSFTKSRQKLEQDIRAELEAEFNTRTPQPSGPTELSEPAQKVRAYMETPEGAALKEVFQEMIKGEMGEVRKTTAEYRADKEIDYVEKRFGKDVIQENYDAIEEAVKANPNIPLRNIVADVLYEKAKDLGAQEYRTKLQQKGEFSSPASSSANTTTSVPVDSFEDAVEQAKKAHGMS